MWKVPEEWERGALLPKWRDEFTRDVIWAGYWKGKPTLHQAEKRKEFQGSPRGLFFFFPSLPALILEGPALPETSWMLNQGYWMSQRIRTQMDRIPFGGKTVIRGVTAKILVFEKCFQQSRAWEWAGSIREKLEGSGSRMLYMVWRAGKTGMCRDDHRRQFPEIFQMLNTGIHYQKDTFQGICLSLFFKGITFFSGNIFWTYFLEIKSFS